MVSKFVLLSNLLLLASAALAVPSSRLGARLARRRENRQSQPVNRIASPAGATSNVQYSSNWAGAVWAEGYGTFTTVTGTFTVPTPSGNSGAASAWVGIDGDTCQNAILQTGVDFTVTNGEVSYDAWYEWYPDYAYDFYGININAGDVITTTVTASSTTSGTAVIENQTTGQTVTQELTSSYALCEENAEWIVEDFEENGSLVPFADFGTVTFTSATGSGTSGTTYTPSGATLLDIEQNGQVLTSVSTNGETATIQYCPTSTQTVQTGPKLLGRNPFARKLSAGKAKNPFARKPEHTKPIQKSEVFFCKVEAVEADQSKQRATNRKGKDKEKDVSRQTTLFGLPSPLAEKKGKPLQKGEEPKTGTGGIEASTSVPHISDVDMSEVPPPSAAATLVETQDVERVATDDTQPIEEEIPIEWEASPPPSPQ